MPTDFPGGVDDIQNDVTNSTVLTDVHPSLHNDLADAVMALETQVLAGGGTVADGSITSAKIADGTIATADLANSAVTNVKLASDTARANLLTNGGFEVWQRGNGPFTGASTWLADRWQPYVAGTDTISVTYNTANKDLGSGGCMACVFTLGSGGGTTGIYQTLKMADGCGLNGRSVSLSIRVRTATANAVRIAIASDAGATDTFSAFHTGSGTYETLSVANFAVPLAATFVMLRINLAASCTAYIDNAMLVTGSVAADYAPLHPAGDFARCQRYYEVLGAEGVGGSGTGNIMISGYTVGAAGVYQPLMYKMIKPVTPTITKNGTWAMIGPGAQPSVGNVGRDAVEMRYTSTGAGQSLVYNAGAGCYVSVEATP